MPPSRTSRRSPERESYNNIERTVGLSEREDGPQQHLPTSPSLDVPSTSCRRVIYFRYATVKIEGGPDP